MVAESQSDQLQFGDHLMSRHVMTQIEKLPLAQKTIVKGVYFKSYRRRQQPNNSMSRLELLNHVHRLALI